MITRHQSLCTRLWGSIKFAPELLLLFSLISLFSIKTTSSSMAEADSSVPKSEPPPPAAAEVHIIYTDQPQGEEPESHHLRTLTSVLGSEEAAKGALLYSYKHATSGFSAKLTPDQVEEISKQPGVLQVVKSRTAELHSAPARMHNL